MPTMNARQIPLVVGLLAVASFSSGLKAQSCSTFDVASIKLNTSGVGGGYPDLAPGGGRFTATNDLMIELIMFAYDVSPLQVSGIRAISPRKDTTSALRANCR